MRARALAGVAIAGALLGCSLLGYGYPPSDCAMLTSDTPLVWAGRQRVWHVLEEGTPEDLLRQNADLLPARAVHKELVGDIYVQAGAEEDPAWRFCVISDAGTVYGFRWVGEWQPPSQ